MADLVGFDFPFQASENGFPACATDIARVGAQIKQVLFTELGERLMRPRFGSRLRSYLFENIDQVTAEAIRAEVARALLESDVDVLVLDISITLENSAPSPHTDPRLVVGILFDRLGRRGEVGLRLARGGEIEVVTS